VIALVAFVSANPQIHSSDVHGHDNDNHVFLSLLYFDIV